MVLVLMLFDLNIMAKAIVGLMIVFCIFVMRSIQTAYQLPDDIDPDTMLPIEPHGEKPYHRPDVAQLQHPVKQQNCRATRITRQR